MNIARLLPLAAALCVACDSSSTPTTASITTGCEVVASMKVSPASVTMAVGDSALLAASPVAPCGVSLPVPFVVFWRSSNTSVVTVDSASGKARGVAAGATTVLAIVVGDTVVKGAAAVQVNSR